MAKILLNNGTKPDKWMFIFFPAVTMLLGWGLRGYIGGGPFGAMIPGAMVALSLSMLLKLPSEMTPVFVVFSAVAIGLGGEMTYGQTLGFLRNPDTVLWGSTGTTVKGAVWGLLGGIVIALGLIHNKLSHRIIITSFMLMLFAMWIGFKLINQPMLIYFSDPAKPRPESWAALLFGAVALWVYLKIKIPPESFAILKKFAFWGCIGGGLGFGLGSQWMTLGNFIVSPVLFGSWWKAMEFSFGLLLGAGFGLAAWRCRKNIATHVLVESPEKSFSTGERWLNLLVPTILIFVIFYLVPALFDDYTDKNYIQDKFVAPGLVDLTKMLSNFAFFGFLLIVTSLKLPSLAWQLGITITFCYSAIDLMQDIYPNYNTSGPFFLYFICIVLMVSTVGILTGWLQRKKNNIARNMFLLLVWACMIIAFIRLGLEIRKMGTPVSSISEWAIKRYFVHIVFTLSALWVSWQSIKLNTRKEYT